MNLSSLLRPIFRRKSNLYLYKKFGCLQLLFVSEYHASTNICCFCQTLPKPTERSKPEVRGFKSVLNPVRFFHIHNKLCQKNNTQTLSTSIPSSTLAVCNQEFPVDNWTNVTPKILSYLGRNLHLQKDHPIYLIKQAIVDHFYASYRKPRGSPIFAVLDSLPPIVTVEQNFDQLLIPEDHVSRNKKDNYYVNKTQLLRAHTTAHEHDLIKSGLDAFLTVGDVYRRDAIDSTHFPVFHQLEGVRLFNGFQLFENSEKSETYQLFENGDESVDKQSCHTLEASKLTEYDLKKTLTNCVEDLFGKDVECRWVDAYFPFTHPSFELEIRYQNEWIEMLGCGVLRQDILNTAGASEKIGWAFGLGLERLAMRLFDIPDIRYFWSTHESILSQFRGFDDIKQIKFKPLISNQPCIMNDISFWVPDDFCSNDLYDVIRSLNTDLVENVTLIDEFTNSKTGKTSHCYRIFYRHTSRALTQKEVSDVHNQLKKEVVEKLGVEGRW